MKKSNISYLLTKQGENLSEIPWNVYPRPQLKRDSIFCLNGEWDFEISDTATFPENFSKKIIVPFAPQSLLSKINKNINDNEYIFYKREFYLPVNFLKERVILNFGASDCNTSVFINGNLVCNHSGGYDSFSADITDFIYKNDINTITIRVFDDLTDSIMPYGKQKQKRGGMWYTPVSGIWQTVWLESVNENYIKKIKIDTNDNFVSINTFNKLHNGIVELKNGNKFEIFELKNGNCNFEIAKPTFWSCENPHLYNITIKTENDTIDSYFALRTLNIKEINGIMRLCLNGEPIFFNGILDQGYFSDGLFTPASLESYTNEITALKEMGFNTIRKHIKIEPQLFYYECDRLGMIVFQDMINNGKYSFIRDTVLPTIGLKKLKDKHLHKNKSTRSEFIKSMENTVEQLYNHPSICLWTIFNEGWGQFCSDEMYQKLKVLDSTRFIDTASGWFKGGKSDVISEHIYFKPFKIKNKKHNKPIILSEFGGYALQIKEHVYNNDKIYGYKLFKSKDELTNALKNLYLSEVVPAIDKGLCAAVYTQVSDIEDEINGIFTYDRKVIKVNAKTLKEISEKLIIK